MSSKKESDMERMRTFVLPAVAACTLWGAAAAQAQVPVEISVPAAAFDNDNGSASCRVAKAHFAYFMADPGAGAEDCDLIAPIALPDGRTLSSITCTLSDASPLNTLQGQLIRVDLLTGLPTTVFTTPGTVDSGSLQQLGDTTPTAGTAIVDNGRYAYYVTGAYSWTDFTTTGNALRVYGCRVTLS
jgi:hypothetical protein